MELTKLVSRAQAGDQAAFAVVCQRFEGLIKKYAFRPHLRPLAEDAQAEAWLAVALAVQSYDKTVGVQFAGYVESRVKYALWNLFKRERRRWQNELSFECQDNEEGGIINTLTDGSDIAAQVELSLLGQEIQEAIKQLPQRQCQVLTMTVTGDMGLAGAACRLGVTVQAVHNLRKRGLARLKKMCSGMYKSERG